MRITALMPCYKIMEIPAVQSLTGLQADIYSKGDKLGIVYANGFNIVQARTMMTKYAVEHESDWVIWLDSDHIYSAGAMYRLIEECDKLSLPMLAANYFVRGGNKQTAHIRFGVENNHFKAEELTGEVMECDVVGFGFLVMRWGFLKDMYDKHGKDLFLMDHTDNTTEDVYFCRKMKQEGHKVCFHSGITVGHLTTVINK